MNKNTCCFFGHRKIELTDELRSKVSGEIKRLIIEEKVDTFLFGSKSEFDDLCYEITSELRKYYPRIKRVYVRSHFPYINDDYLEYLLESYEETYYPDNILNAGRASYVERNYEMINKSRFCIIYFDKKYVLPKQNDGHKPKSGTKIAYDYALKKKKTIINVFK